MKHKISIFFILFLCLSLKVEAQQACVTSGGNANGINGNVSYSIGQVFYVTQSSGSGSIEEGVQHGVRLCTAPTIPSNLPASRCGSGAITLAASPSAGSIQWFTASTGGTALNSCTDYTVSGNNLTINNLSSTKTFYAEAVDGSCHSVSRTAVEATIVDCSELTSSWCGTTVAGITNTLNYSAVAGATNYEIWVQGPSGYSQKVSRNSNSTNFKLSWFPGILYSTTYTVQVRALVGGNWTLYGNACSLSTPAVGNTKLIPANCGITLTSLDQVLEYNEIYGASNYEVWVQGPNSYSTIKQRNTNATSFKLSWFNGLQPGTTYTVKVRSFVDGSWSAWNGTACNVTTPGAPTSQLVPGNCNHTLTTPDEILSYEAIQGASNYEIWVQGPSSYSQTMFRNNNKTTFRLSWFTGLMTNTTYSVQVRSYVNGVWGAWGPACDVSTLGSLSMMQNNTPASLDNSVALEDVDLEAYPNPNNGEFTIRSTHEGTFKMMNELGQLIQTIEFTPENNLEIKIKGLHAGLYFITGIINGNVETSKITVQ